MILCLKGVFRMLIWSINRVWIGDNESVLDGWNFVCVCSQLDSYQTKNASRPCVKIRTIAFLSCACRRASMHCFIEEVFTDNLVFPKNILHNNFLVFVNNRSFQVQVIYNVNIFYLFTVHPNWLGISWNFLAFFVIGYNG